MTLEWEQTIVASRDPASLGRWWQQALGWAVVNDDPDEFEIRPAADQFPGLLFVAVPEPKTVQNRLHLDFRPDDQGREVERMLALGASRVDIGQGEQSWVVLADPEGNEFCILSSRRPQLRRIPPELTQSAGPYIRDPDGHLIEVGQTTDPEGDWTPDRWPSG